MIANAHGHLVCIASSAGLVGISGLAGKKSVIFYVCTFLLTLTYIITLSNQHCLDAPIIKIKIKKYIQ